jgi:hypothetical protein
VRGSRLVAAICGLLAIACLSTWLLAAESRGALPDGNFTAQTTHDWTLTGSDADALRRDALRRARVRLSDAGASVPPPPRLRRNFPEGHSAKGNQPNSPLHSETVTCRFLSAIPTGTSAKFDCVLDGGEVVKIKYSRNPEIQAEVAATMLVHALGFGADHVEIVPRVRCHGCPRFPFLAMRLLSPRLADSVIGHHGYEDGYTDFEWVALERKFPAPAIETPTTEGWAWWELRDSAAPVSELDALRLLAVFLAHWDNKSENQRLVCLDHLPAKAGSHDVSLSVADVNLRVASGFSRKNCDRPFALLHDLGATFGPKKVNLARWREFPIWSDRSTCQLSMRRLPFGGGTFPDVTVSEEGRVLLGRQLVALSDAEVRSLFETARFPDYHSATDDGRDLEAWTRAFRFRVDQILTAGPCPA